MDERRIPLTCARPRRGGPQLGMMAPGKSAFPSETATQRYMNPMHFAGQYATDDYTAAVFLVNQLSSPDSGLTPEESKAAALLLRELLQKLKVGVNVTADALKSLQESAEKIPEIGPLMFSMGNLPGTVASMAGSVLAVSKAKKVSDLLDMTPAQKAKLHKWANSRGTPGAKSASKTFKGAIKIISVAGQRYFEVPVTASAQYYRVLGQVGSPVAHIPLANTKSVLNQRAHLHSEGARGPLRFATGNVVGAVLAVGPQAYLDWNSATTTEDFWRKTAESQPTNVASFAGGLLAGALVVAIAGASTPFIVVLGVGWLAGLGVQKVMASKGYDKDAEGWLNKKIDEFID